MLVITAVAEVVFEIQVNIPAVDSLMPFNATNAPTVKNFKAEIRPSPKKTKPN